MGIEPSLVATSLVYIGTEIGPENYDDCKTPYTPSPQELERWDLQNMGQSIKQMGVLNVA